MKVGLVSDSHSFTDVHLLELFSDRDEIWHAGDFGSIEVINELKRIKPLKGVYGNIDNANIQSEFPEELSWQVGKFKIYMTHIAGYPGKYVTRVKKKLIENPTFIYLWTFSYFKNNER